MRKCLCHKDLRGFVYVFLPLGGRTQPDLDYLSNIIATFHDIWGNCDWTDEDKIKKQIQELPATVKDNEEYQNAMKHSDAQNARDVCERILQIKSKNP